ncbi:MAG: CDP-diacylglycerol--glycerol-3-phosphate 3-phosphatidyltransferase [Ignavibacteria bacterium RBG_13_36_8]|nr:MAG: CDP-diacylglycerol--glycerol-3-phosphate 3-phosphatidyltransferase [Ignavibacteria bacterium RBG_13_36_8]
MLLPNQLTTLRIILTPVFLFLFLSEDPFYKQLSLIVYILAAITDWYDGWLARKFNYITAWGKFMDPLADKILTSAAFLAFVILGVLELWMVIIIVVRDFLVTGLRLFADSKKINFSTSNLARTKTFIQMAFIYYLLLVYTAISFAPLYKGNEKIFAVLTDPQLVYYSMLFVTLLTLYSGISYIFNNRILILQLFSFENKNS